VAQIDKVVKEGCVPLTLRTRRFDPMYPLRCHATAKHLTVECYAKMPKDKLVVPYFVMLQGKQKTSEMTAHKRKQT